MIKILLISENVNLSKKFDGIFNKNPYEYYIMTDETMISDLLKADAPDIIFIDQEFENHIKER